MSTYYYTGLAPLAAQVSTQTFGTYDASTTRKITIGGITISHVDATDLATSLTALAVLLNASTHPYFKYITWLATATTIQGTSDVLGMPFIMTGAVSGGTGTVSNSGVQVNTTANSGPNDISVAANYSGGVYPSAADTVIFANSANNLAWGGLSVGSTGLAVMRQELSFTGKVGLDYLKFAITADGATYETIAPAPEYRNVYLPIDAIQARFGDSSPLSSSSGSGRVMWNFGSTINCTVEIVATSNSTSDTGRPAIRFIANKTGHAINVRSAPGGVGICAEVPGETTTIGTINISDQTGTSKLVTGRGITINTSWTQDGGTNLLASDQTMPLIVVNGGTLTTEGAGAVTALNSYGGTTNHNSSGTTSTITMRGGTLTGYGSAVARAWTTINIWHGSTLTFDPAVITASPSIVPQERITIAT